MGWVKNPNTSNIQWKTGRKKKTQTSQLVEYFSNPFSCQNI